MQVFLIQSHIWEDFTLVRSDSFLNRLGKRKENHSNLPPATPIPMKDIITDVS